MAGDLVSNFCGLYISCPEGNGPRIPLKSVDVKARLVDFVAQVSLEQVYRNDEGGPIEAIYMFPLDEGASVVQFEARLDGRTVNGVVKEKHEAEKQYNNAIQQRRAAALLRQSKADIFQVRIGNLAPGSEATIKLAYLSEMEAEGDNNVRFYIPTTVAPRYVPSTDTSPESQEIQSIPYSNFSPAPMKIQVQCEMKSRICKMSSPSHDIIAVTQNDKAGGKMFKGEAKLEGVTTDMDRDFVLLVSTDDPHHPRAGVEKFESSVAAFVSLVPSFKMYEQLTELVFVTDRSGSMGRDSTELARRALTLFLRSLPADCYFNIVGFGSSFSLLFPRSVKYDSTSLETALNYVQFDLRANLGGTEIYEPLEAIFSQEQITGYVRQIFVLTDGRVSNTDQVISLVHQNCHKSRVFALGIGDHVSHHLVSGIARAGGGTAVFATRNESLEPKVQRQLKNALCPALTDIAVKWEGTSSSKSEPVKTSEESAPKPAPFNVPPVFNGSRLLVYCIWEKGVVPTGVTITAKTPDGPLSSSVTITEDDLFQGDIVHKLAARKLIRDLEEGSSYLHKNKDDAPLREVVANEIVQLGCKYNMVSTHTSFVAVDPENQTAENDFSLSILQTRRIPNYGGPVKFCRIKECLRLPIGTKRPGFERLESERLETGSQQCSSSSDGWMPAAKRMPPFLTEIWDLSDTTVDTTTGTLDSSGSNLGMSPLERRTHELLSFMEFDGGYKADPGFAKAVEICWEEIQAAGHKVGVKMECWLTALGVAFLEMKLGSRKDMWELAAEKSKKWLSTQVTEADSLLTQAGDFLKSKGIHLSTL